MCGERFAAETALSAELARFLLHALRKALTANQLIFFVSKRALNKKRKEKERQNSRKGREMSVIKNWMRE